MYSCSNYFSNYQRLPVQVYYIFLHNIDEIAAELRKPEYGKNFGLSQFSGIATKLNLEVVREMHAWDYL